MGGQLRIEVQPGLRRGPTAHARRVLCRRVRRAGARLGIRAAEFAGLGLRIVGDREMARLHMEYMGERGPTDVLSFSPAQGVGIEAGDPLGDLVLNWHAVIRQARHPDRVATLDEATALCVHGLVHLLGHDHGDRAEGRSMYRLERRVLFSMNVPDFPRPYVHGRGR